MSTYVVYTSPARGHLYPIMPTLLELRERGHRIVVCTLAAEHATVTEQGLEHRPLAPEIEARPIDDYEARTPLGSITRAQAIFSDRADHEVGDLQAALADARPDALLVDINSRGAAAAAEASALAWAQWTPFPMPIREPGVPPFGFGLRPSRHPLARVRDAALEWPFLRRMDRLVLPRINPLRERLGLAPWERVLDTFTTAPLNLYLTAEPFEYPRRWPDNVELVGPGIWTPPADPPGWLEELEGRVVLVTCSTEYQHDEQLIQTALDALAREPVSVVATSGAGDPGQFTVPANARVVRFAPHQPIIDRAACVVCHGGMGITQKALASGVPVCAVPFGRDQFEVARRVTEAGAGARLPAPRLSANRLAARIREARSRTAGAEQVAESFARAGGAPRAADLVERLVARAPVALR